MPWVRIDDLFPEDPKITGLSDRAFRVWLEGLAYCARQLSDGHIPASSVKTIRGTRKSVDELVNAGLWQQNGTGYVVQNYLKFNPSKAQVEARREAGAKRLKRWREQHNDDEK